MGVPEAPHLLISLLLIPVRPSVWPFLLSAPLGLADYSTIKRRKYERIVNEAYRRKILTMRSPLWIREEYHYPPPSLM